MVTEFKKVNLQYLDASPFQVRENALEEIEGLVTSIESDEIGIRNAPLVRAVGSRYQIASGHRRVEAARMAGLESIWVRVEKLGDEDMKREILVENIHRRDFTNEENYRALEQYRLALGLENDFYHELSRRTGLSDEEIRHIYETININKELNIHISGNAEKIEASLGVVAASSGLDKPEKLKLIRKAVDKGWSQPKVRVVKKALKEMEPKAVIEVLKPETEVTPKVIERLAELPKEIQQDAIKEIRVRRLNESDTLKMIDRLKTGTQPQTLTVVNEADDVMNDFRETMIHIKTWGVNQYGILGLDGWGKARLIFDEIEQHMQRLKRM